MTGLSEEGRLLVAGNPCNGHLRATDGSLRTGTGGRDHLRQHRTRNVEQGEELVVPLAAMDVVEHGATGIRCIGHMACAGGEIPHEPAVDGAECELAASRTLPRARHV